MESISKWKTHSNRASFIEQFDAITVKYRHDNDLRTRKLEEYLIEEAKNAGVIKAHPVKI